MGDNDKEDRRKYKGPKFDYNKFWRPFKNYREILNEARENIHRGMNKKEK